MNMDSPDTCNDICKLLYAYMDNELDSIKSLDVESHLESCPCCKEKFRSIQQVREEIRHHVLRIEAPLRLKKQIMRVCPESKRCSPFLFAALAVTVLLAIGYYWLPTLKPTPTSLHRASLLAHPASAVGSHLSLDGELVCLRCLMNQKGVGLAPCSEIGHAFALRTPDNSIWVLLPSSRLKNLIDHDHPPLNSRIHVEGLLADRDQSIIDVSRITHSPSI